MMGRTHVLFGSAAFVGAVELVQALADNARHFSVAGVLLGTTVCAGASLLPDFDQKGSTAARCLGGPTLLLAMVISKISGGHREATHSLLGIAAFGGVAALLQHERHGLLGGIAYILFLALLIGGAMRALRVKPFRWERAIGLGNLITSSVIAYGVVAVGVDTSIVPWAVVFGVYLHILGDCCSDSGCPILWPWRMRFAVLPKWARFTTGDDEGFSAEKHVITPVLATATVCLVVHLTVAAGALHLDPLDTADRRELVAVPAAVRPGR
jgi:membrane-bound metal-dependent hydrolase YbcI (DUF457 family)